MLEMHFRDWEEDREDLIIQIQMLQDANAKLVTAMKLQDKVIEGFRYLTLILIAFCGVCLFIALSGGTDDAEADLSENFTCLDEVPGHCTWMAIPEERTGALAED